MGLAIACAGLLLLSGQSLSVAVAAAVFTSFRGAAAGAALVAGREMLSLEHVRTLQQTFAAALDAALMVCALVAAIGIVTAVLAALTKVIAA